MASNPLPAEQRLVDVLASAALYNDTGIESQQHSADKMVQVQLRFRNEQLALAKQIGTWRVGAELLAAIESGAAARDWSGRYLALAEQVLGLQRH